MKKSNKADVAVVGAGIVGLAIAYTLAKKGLKVVVFERSPLAIGASIRNFGLLWPIGQAPGKLYERALRSRSIWDELCVKASIWKNNNGSLHLAYKEDESEVLQEFYEKSHRNGYQCELWSKAQIIGKNSAVNPDHLLSGLFSKTEATIDPREAISKLPGYLESAYNVQFKFGCQVNTIDYPSIETKDEIWQAERFYVCSGADFETLYPQIYEEVGFTKCKLQMMRTSPQPDHWKLGPTLCGGLTLTHYAAFKHCNALTELKQRFEQESPEFTKWGIHVMITQNGLRELVIGDSHEYGLDLKPFDKEEINKIILSYLNTFTKIPSLEIAERWHGIYPKLMDKTDFVMEAEKNVTIVNGLGGAGMTLSFGLAEEIIG